jgi:hypothetical protein
MTMHVLPLLGSTPAGGTPLPVPDAPSFPIPLLHVRPWADPVIDEVGFDARSPYVERYWLAVLGPSATWLVRHLADRLEHEPAGFDLDLAHAATCIGLGHRGGRDAPFLRTVRRVCQFGAAQLHDADVLWVRRKLPPLTRAQLDRLPESLRAEHPRWVARPPGDSAAAIEAKRRRARRLALSLLELGEDGESTERQLHRWKVHPALASEATSWALHRHRAAAAAAAASPRPAGSEPVPAA